MNGPMILTFVILTVTIILFIIDKLRIDIVAMLALLALVLTGLIDSNQALAGFANSTVVTIAALFVVGEGLFQTGVADWMGDRLIRLAGSSETRLLVTLMVGTAVLSAFLSNTGTVAVLLPVVVAAAWRIRSMPSKLLIPGLINSDTPEFIRLPIFHPSGISPRSESIIRPPLDL